MPDLGRDIPVSPQKLQFVSKDLPRLVKGYHFWMDILAVDQSSEETRVRVVTQIPQIYRKARFTLVIREQGGICSGCSDAMAELDISAITSDTPDEMAFVRSVVSNLDSLNQHMLDRHPNGLRELWMERNWPLQELLLSNRVKFAICEELPGQTVASRPRLEGLPPSVDAIKVRTTMLDMVSLAKTWVGSYEPNQDGDLLEDFMDAVIYNGEVDRPSVHEWNPNLFDQLRGSSNSIRQSGKSRDYILAVLPQFAWYQLPVNVKSMGFGQVYEDAMLQIGEKYRESYQQEEEPSRYDKIRTKITKGMLGGLSDDERSSFQPSSDVPAPECLGDVCKLMHFVRDAGTRQASPEVDQFLLQPVDTEGPITYILALIADSLWFAHVDLQAEWTYQFAMWRDNMPQLLKLVCGMSPGLINLSTMTPEPSSLDTAQLPLFVMEVMTEIGRIQAAAHGGLGSYAMEEVSRIVLNNNLDASRQAILRESTSLSQDWTKAINLFAKADSPAFRDLLLTTTAAACCGFGMSAVPWLSEKLKVYLLMGHDIATGDLLQTLVFAAKNLDVDNLDGVQAFTADIEPYVVVDAAEASSKRVVGLAPKPGNWMPNTCRPDGV